MKMTKHRKAIIDTLSCHPGALTAQEIHERVGAMNLVTVYRNLDILVEQGPIKKMFLGNSEAVYEYQHHPHHHAICDTCHDVIHFDVQTAEIKEILSEKGFNVENIDITVHGQCQTKHKN
jgi:Fe2+ or Zn2+ uptake regulation protein